MPRNFGTVRGFALVLAVGRIAAAGAPALHPEEVIDVQRGTKSQLENLEARLAAMAERLEKIAPDDATKTRKVEKELRDRDVVRDMGTVIGLLGSGNYTTAIENQERIIAHLREVIRNLEGRKLAAADWQAQLERVKAAGAAIRNLLAEQRSLRAESQQGVDSQEDARTMGDLARDLGAIAAGEERLARELPNAPLEGEARIEELARRVGALAERQEKVLAETKKAPGIGELDAVRDRVEETAGKLSSGENPGSAAQSLEDLAGQVADRLGDKALGESLRAAARNGLETPEKREAAARAVRLAREKTERGAPLAALVPDQAALESASRDIERELGDARKAAGGDHTSTDAAKDALGQASKQMEGAAQALQSGDQKEAMSGQENAAGALRRAEQALGETAKALRGRDRFERAADAQRELAGQTDAAREAAKRLRRKLGEKDGSQDSLASAEGALERARGAMSRAQEAFERRSPEGASRAGEAANELAEAKRAIDEETLKRLRRHDLEKVAGRQDALKKEAEDLSRDLRRGEESGLRRAGGKVERAGGQMGRASEKLREGQANDGAEAQERAAEELEQAERDLTREEKELERLKQEQEITTMVELLVKIRDGQQTIAKEVAACEADRRPDGTLPRSRLLSLRGLEKQERGLLADAATVKGLLVKENADVFAFVVDDIVGDMEQLTEALGQAETSEYTQLLARDVVEKIEKLLAALKQELADRRREQSKEEGDQAQQGPMRLIPPVAEALMLKRMQLALKDATQALERARQANNNEVNPAMERHLKRLALRQGSLATLTRKVARDFFGLVPEEEKGDGVEKKK